MIVKKILGHWDSNGSKQFLCLVNRKWDWRKTITRSRTTEQTFPIWLCSCLRIFHYMSMFLCYCLKHTIYKNKIQKHTGKTLTKKFCKIIKKSQNLKELVKNVPLPVESLTHLVKLRSPSAEGVLSSETCPLKQFSSSLNISSSSNTPQGWPEHKHTHTDRDSWW